MKFDQDLCLNFWYELNPRVRCAFGNVSLIALSFFLYIWLRQFYCWEISVGTFYCWEIWEALLRDLKLIWGEQTIRITSHTQGWFGVGFPRTRMVLSPLTWISWWLMYVVARWRLIGSFPVCSNTSPCVCDPGLPAPSATQGLLGLSRENTELERISTPLKSSTVVKDFNESQTTSKLNPTSTWSF